jgi:hypothetical protein
MFIKISNVFISGLKIDFVLAYTVVSFFSQYIIYDVLLQLLEENNGSALFNVYEKVLIS